MQRSNKKKQISTMFNGDFTKAKKMKSDTYRLTKTNNR
jgi:hypothetical protein